MDPIRSVNLPVFVQAAVVVPKRRRAEPNARTSGVDVKKNHKKTASLDPAWRWLALIKIV
jgi:hypothetical protein